MPKHLVLAVLIVNAGCFSGNRGIGGAGGGAGGQGGGGNGGGALTGVPCDVAAVIQDRCLGCHNGGALSASSLRLTSYDDLVAPSPRNGTQTVAELALSRIESPDRPMPPPQAGQLSDAEVQAFANWVAADLPPGDCGAGGGVAGGGALDPGLYDTPTVCTSNRMWRGGGGGGEDGEEGEGDDGSWNMAPGRACISCHQRSEGPRFDVAGTVYPTAHEPDDCQGTGSGLTIVITDATGQRFRLTPNSVGNFGQGHTGIVLPYTASVEGNGSTRVMSTAQTSGDCNSCHTEHGDQGAPGRIMAP